MCDVPSVDVANSGLPEFALNNLCDTGSYPITRDNSHDTSDLFPGMDAGWNLPHSLVLLSKTYHKPYCACFPELLRPQTSCKHTNNAKPFTHKNSDTRIHTLADLLDTGVQIKGLGQPGTVSDAVKRLVE